MCLCLGRKTCLLDSGPLWPSRLLVWTAIEDIGYSRERTYTYAHRDDGWDAYNT